MKVLAGLVSVAILVSASAQSSRAATPEAAAEAAALVWLHLVDAGKYAESWDTAAPYFKRNVPQQRWASVSASVRAPLGEVKSRSLSSTKFTRSLPGAPDAEYVVMQFSTSFENKADATETVTTIKGAGGQWRVVGYYIR